MDFCGIPEGEDVRVFFAVSIFVPGNERLCSRTAVLSFLSYFLARTRLSELELFLDLDVLLLEDRDEEERPFCADNSSGRVRNT